MTQLAQSAVYEKRPRQIFGRATNLPGWTVGETLQACEAILEKHRHEMLSPGSAAALEPVSERVPQWLRDIIVERNRNGERQSELSELLEISKVTIGKICRAAGNKSMGRGKARKVA